MVKGITVDTANSMMKMPASYLSLANMTVARLREAVMTNFVLSGPGVIHDYMPSQIQLGYINEACKHAVQNGQVIDFGFWPNEMIKQTQRRTFESVTGATMKLARKAGYATH